MHVKDNQQEKINGCKFMFECQFKMSEDDNVKGTLYTIRQQRRKSNIVFIVLLCVSLLLMISTLIWDIRDGESIAFDIFLLVLIVALLILYICFPILFKANAKRVYKTSIADRDLMIVKIDETKCDVSFQKNGEEVSRSVMDLSTLTSCIEDDERLVLVFNRQMFVVVRKDSLTGNLDSLKLLIQKYMNKPIVKMK